MALKAFKRYFSDDYDINTLQDRLEEYFRNLTKNTILDGILIEDVSLTTGSVQQVEHKLNRSPLGWIVVRNDADSRLWETETSTDSTYLGLNTSASNTVTLWVF